MLRSSTVTLSRALAARSSGAAARSTNASRSYSSPASPARGGGGGGGKAALGAAALLAAGAGGTLAYASVDPDFRKTVEETVPGSDAVFAAVLGEPEKAAAPPPKKAPAKIPVTSAPPSKKRPIVVQEEAKPAVESDATPAVPSPPLEKPTYLGGEAKEAAAKKEETKVVEEVKESKAKPVKKVAQDVSTAPKEVVAEEKPEAKQDAVVAKKESAKERKKRVVEVSNQEDEEEATERAILEGKDLHKKMTQVRQSLEAEMVSQLRRQAEAHSEHLEDSLDVQKRELTRKHLRELDEALEKSETEHRREISRLLGHLRGLSEGLQGRAEMDGAALQVQELWLACSALLQAVASGGEGGTDVEVRSLYEEVEAVKRAAEQEGSDSKADPFVKAVLESIPEEASTRGIYTEDSIRERFRTVERVARRTAMIGDEGGSLFKYLLSYLQSLLVLSPSTDEMPAKSVPCDVDALGTFDLVWLAKGHLERGDLDQAVRYMTLLRGEPRRAAADWLREARLLLETRQACRALMAHAAAVGVEALPQRREK